MASELEPWPGRLTFYALRHGQSLANVAGVISSAPVVALGAAHGLSDTGREQAVRAAGAVVALARQCGCGVAVCSSDFSRAWQTACCVYDAAAAAGIFVWPAGGKPKRETQLRERWFGELDGGPDTEYPSVWAVDALDASHTHFNVESVDAVRARVRSLAARLRDEVGKSGGGDGLAGITGDASSDAEPHADLGSSGERWIVLLVAHGDVLQIAQTLFAGISGTRHRELPHLPTATLRRLGAAPFPAADGPPETLL
jgi:broad specificity phosphatase PhoE